MRDIARHDAASSICPHVVRMHQLAWTPGRHLHPMWWAHLGLDGWDADYAAHPGCCRAIDTLIVERRGFPTGALPASLDDSQQKLLALEGRLPSLLTALGIVAGSASELLLLGKFRRALIPVLGETGCDQLCAFLAPAVPRTGLAETLEPGDIASRGLMLGCQWMHLALGGCEVWQALAVRFPPERTGDGVPEALLRHFQNHSPLPTLFRLDRLL